VQRKRIATRNQQQTNNTKPAAVLPSPSSLLPQPCIPTLTPTQPPCIMTTPANRLVDRLVLYVKTLSANAGHGISLPYDNTQVLNQHNTAPQYSSQGELHCPTALSAARHAATRLQRYAIAGHSHPHGPFKRATSDVARRTTHFSIQSMHATDGRRHFAGPQTTSNQHTCQTQLSSLALYSKPQRHVLHKGGQDKGSLT
jgi:hypothetical protein